MYKYITDAWGASNDSWVKFTNVSSIGKNDPGFFQNFSVISLA